MEKKCHNYFAPTPVLTGKDAARFLKKMHEAETKPLTAEEKKRMISGKRMYDDIKRKEIERILKRIAEKLQIDIPPDMARVLEEEFWNLVR